MPDSFGTDENAKYFVERERKIILPRFTRAFITRKNARTIWAKHQFISKLLADFF